jgi:hypothetical protein
VSLSQADGLDVGLLRDAVADAPAPQVLAARAVAVGLIGGEAVGLLARPSRAGPSNADLLQDRLELGAASPLPCCDDEGQRTATAIGTQVELAGEPAGEQALPRCFGLVFCRPGPF